MNGTNKYSDKLYKLMAGKGKSPEKVNRVKDPVSVHTFLSSKWESIVKVYTNRL